jgi:hypothetical protein
VAAALIREEGVPYKPIPWALHGLDLFYAAGRLAYGETALYHAKTFFRRATDGSLDPLREVELYRGHQVPRLYPETRVQRLARRLRGESQPPKADSILKLCARLEELVRGYVVPAFA